MYCPRLVCVLSLALLLPACSEAMLNPSVAALCRNHANNVLVFQSAHGRHVLPVDEPMTREQDAAWRAELGLPPNAGSYGPDMLTRRIAAVTQIENGWLVGTDMGEWGGALFLLREGAPPQRITYGNVHALVPTQGGVYALFGLAHGGSDEGHYRFISVSDGAVVVGEEQPLPGSPIAIATDEEVFVAGGSGRNHEHTWARVFGRGEPIEATVAPACR